MEEEKDKQKPGKEKPKIPIDLPEIKFPTSKLAKPSSSQTPKEEPKTDIPFKKFPEKPLERPADRPMAKPAEKPVETHREKVEIPGELRAESPKPITEQSIRVHQGPGIRPLIPVIFLLILVIGMLGITLVFYMFSNTDLKERLESNAKVAKEIVASKEEVMEESKTFLGEIDRLRADYISSTSRGDALDKQVDSLKKELDNSREKYAKLQETIKEYAEEVRKLAAKRIGYYNAYVTEKENAKNLNNTISQIKEQLEDLRSSVASIDEEYKEKEATLIYDTALLYLEAGLFNKAVRTFENYVEAFPDDANAYYNLGYIHEKVIKDRKKAINHYTKYLELHPEAEDLYEVRMKIASLERSGTKEPLGEITGRKPIKINLDEIKY